MGKEVALTMGQEQRTMLMTDARVTCTHRGPGERGTASW